MFRNDWKEAAGSEWFLLLYFAAEKRRMALK